ncbi:MAG: hypothetical protein QM790_17105 [Nibricoccus sp.]
MIRLLFYFSLVVVVATAAAWYSARGWTRYNVRKQEARVVAAEQAEMRRLARVHSEIVRACDEVVIEYDDSHEGGRNGELRFSDTEWIEKLAAIVETASCKEEDPALMIILPMVRLYKRQPQSYVEIMGGAVLLAEYGKDRGRWVWVGAASAEAIRKLIDDKIAAAQSKADAFDEVKPVRLPFTPGISVGVTYAQVKVSSPPWWLQPWPEPAPRVGSRWKAPLRLGE